MNDTKEELLWHQVKCPKCGQIVNQVDKEYERHYVVANIICTSSRRRIEKQDAAAITAEIAQWDLPEENHNG